MHKLCVSNLHSCVYPHSDTLGLRFEWWLHAGPLVLRGSHSCRASLTRRPGPSMGQGHSVELLQIVHRRFAQIVAKHSSCVHIYTPWLVSCWMCYIFCCVYVQWWSSLCWCSYFVVLVAVIIAVLVLWEILAHEHSIYLPSYGLPIHSVVMVFQRGCLSISRIETSHFQACRADMRIQRPRLVRMA